MTERFFSPAARYRGANVSQQLLVVPGLLQKVCRTGLHCPYAVLDLSPGATHEQILAAYLRLRPALRSDSPALVSLDCETERRALLAEMGTTLPDDIEIRVWDSSAEVRYLVLPQRPAGTAHLTEDELASIVTRDAMIGVARL